MAIFSELNSWVDYQPRSGVENMAVDQLLLESSLPFPLIRFYQWSEPTVSFGYFEKLSDAKRDFPGDELRYVRRWTGGGIVDHREDQTYSLFFPKGHPVEQLRGNGSYAAIHEALAISMRLSGVECALTVEDSDSEARACFIKPVPYDIVDSSGLKLAGAGQKRSRYGLLHQGSVQGIKDVARWQALFSAALAEHVTAEMIDPERLGNVAAVVAQRYGTEAWMSKRA